MWVPKFVSPGYDADHFSAFTASPPPPPPQLHPEIEGLLYFEMAAFH